MIRHFRPSLLALLAALAACGFPDVNFATGGESSAGGEASTGGAVGIGGSGGASEAGGGLLGGGGETGVTGVPVALGTAENYVVLAKSGITNVPPSVINGNMGVSPIAVGAITGFFLTPDPSGEYSTSLQVSGNVYAASHSTPTPQNLLAAVSDMQQAFVAAAARLPDFNEIGEGDIGGRTLVPGVYHWSTPLSIPTTLTLTGSSTDVWVFQIAQTLTVSSAAQVFLTGGAQARNVFWQVSGVVDIGTAAHLEGVVLAATSIAMHTGASMNGRLLAQTGVTFEGATVAEPGR